MAPTTSPNEGSEAQGLIEGTDDVSISPQAREGAGSAGSAPANPN